MIVFEKCFGIEKKCWHKCITSNGDFFGGGNINVDKYMKNSVKLVKIIVTFWSHLIFVTTPADVTSTRSNSRSKSIFRFFFPVYGKLQILPQLLALFRQRSIGLIFSVRRSVRRSESFFLFKSFWRVSQQRFIIILWFIYIFISFFTIVIDSSSSAERIVLRGDLFIIIIFFRAFSSVPSHRSRGYNIL